jgi:peptidoglycan/xylan/chitin deacetylase (PgdA/CDA1 family)
MLRYIGGYIMAKKLLTITLAFIIILSMGKVSADVQDINIQGSNDNIKNNIEENIQNETPILGNSQYSITEAQGPITEDKTDRIIDPNKPMIAVTYDDGPSIYTPEILDVLKENNSVASFFVLGQSVYNNGDILNRMIVEGNQIGNHTYNHKNITTISDEELYKQVQGTDDLIYMTTGYTPTVMRPPYGSTNVETNKKITKPLIHWSIDTKDWENKNVEMIKNSILENVKDGDIILMHDIYDSTVEASKVVIPELVNRGYQLVTIDELVEFRGIMLLAGEQYYNMYK